jgi:hypothetical protein
MFMSPTGERRLMDGQTDHTRLLSDRELVLQFESLGDNCELGMLQRRVGEEPLGLLRFASAPLPGLLTALDLQFAGIDDPGNIRLWVSHGEYLVRLDRYGFNYHTHVQVGRGDPATLHQQQASVVRFLAEKLIGDLRQPDKIFVFRQNEPLLASDLLKLRAALSKYGPVVLLWVREAEPGEAPGTVTAMNDLLLVGTIRALAPRQHVPDLDVSGWLIVLRRAFRLVMMQRGLWRPALGTTVLFGRDGNAGAALGYGWSLPETGFTWATGERSLLLLDNPGRASRYRLEIDGSPFDSKPLLPRQRLDLLIDGKLVHSFDPVPRGAFGCDVPGHLIGEREPVELVLNHPLAASPMLVAGANDSRRLAVAFRRLSLLPL